MTAAPLAAQALPDGRGTSASARVLGGTHLYGEVFGASFYGLSFNVEQPVSRLVAVRGGLGALPELFGDDVNVALIGGLALVPGRGPYHPEIGATVTAVLDADR